ncbi:MAG: PD40 domain-containing protein [Candidatus Sericytochromatia bacterium]|nr:PD40 domain-containing protein [Candidatus Sericytochromatia bacterium]
MKKIIRTVFMSALVFTSLTSCVNLRQMKDEKEIAQNRNILIPYITKIGNKVDLFVSDISGKNRVQLTNDAFEEADPSILPNGKVMFSSKRTGTWQVYVINNDGSGLKAITKDKGFNNYRPALTIDGSILIVSDREVKPKIYSIDPDGENVTKLTDADNYYDYPSPLDDGTILYLSNEGSKWEIWKMNADGSNKKKITTSVSKPLSLAAMPSYVRDISSRISGINDNFVNLRNSRLNNNFVSKAVFTARDKTGDMEIYRINIDGTDLRNLTKVPGVDANPVVLKNGKIAFTSDRDGTFDVWVMDADGYNPINMTKEPYYASTR